MRENQFLQWVLNQPIGGGARNAHAQHGGPANPNVILGPGDDMAVVALPGPGASPNIAARSLAFLKIDQALDQVHFDLRQHTPQQAGRKAVNRCLSDCAAMACCPLAVLISVALPRIADLAFAQALFTGCQAAADDSQCAIVGGDTAVWNQRLAITVAALGAAPQGVLITRAGAKAGDAICVTGRLGGSILGRHMEFSPRIALAQEIIKSAHVHAMMDLSDGLAADLPRICAASGVGAMVRANLLPVHPDAQLLAAQDGLSASRHALVDGEDYELLMALAPAEAQKLLKLGGADGATPVTVIGHFTEERRLALCDAAGAVTPWPAGFEHQSAGAEAPECASPNGGRATS